MATNVIKNSKFIATDEKGPVSALLQIPDNPKALLLLAHGAGANMQHLHMESITKALSESEIASFRFNFPYMEAGGKRTDSIPVCTETFANAVQSLSPSISKLPLFIGGHSFGGRMASHFVSQQLPNSIGRGLIYFSFPLHPSKKPDVKRADHLFAIETPMLFLSGTRDTLADPELLEQVASDIPKANIHWLQTADHGFKILKRTRTSTEDVYDEAARIASEFVDQHLP
jgi:predicted alpha/beta-hydrolase family hydrolase